jgi:hypothetical protein
MDQRSWRRVVLAAVLLAATVSVDSRAAEKSEAGLGSTAASPAQVAPVQVAAAARADLKPGRSRLGAISVPHENFQWYVDHGYDFMARISGGPEGSEAAVHKELDAHGIEHFSYGRGSMRISEMGEDVVPPQRRGLKRGPGANKYINSECVCGGWGNQYRFVGEKTAAKIKNWLESGIIFEDYLNRSLCYCAACEGDYRKATGEPGFPQIVYDTPHYEDTVAFDPTLIEWDQQRLADNLRIMADPIHRAGKKVMVAGVCRWIVGAEAAAAVDGVMFYTYYAGRRLPPNFMRNWKYWHDHLIANDLWVIFGYFREYHPSHTRVMLANLPDGVNLAFWACQRQVDNPTARDDALYARDVVESSLVPIRIAVYDSSATQAYWAREQRSWRETHVEKLVLGLERLGLDAKAVTSLENLDQFELIYLEDVECLSRAELDRIKKSGIPVLATGVSGLRDKTGRLWGEVDSGLRPRNKEDKALNLPAPITLSQERVNIEVESIQLSHPWFAFMFKTFSKDFPVSQPAERYRGVSQHTLSLIPSRTYGEFLENAAIASQDGVPLASTDESQRPMIVYHADAQQVYSTVKFSDYVNVHDLTECGYGYEMRQFCFLQMIDAMTLPRRGIRVEPYLMTAMRTTDNGHFLTIGNVYDEPTAVTVTLDRQPKAVRVNHVRFDGWDGRKIKLPPIAAKDAVQLHVDY